MEGLEFQSKGYSFICGCRCGRCLVRCSRCLVGHVGIKARADQGRSGIQNNPKLTEQNKRLAIRTVEAIDAALDGLTVDGGHHSTRYVNEAEKLLEEANVPADERNRILGRTNSIH